MRALTSYYCKDEGDQLQPVTLLSYDRNKYCEVRLSDGTVEEIKTGYLYGLDKKLLRHKLLALPKHPCLPDRTRLQQLTELRKERRRKSQWSVSTTDFSTFHLYSTKAQAVKQFLRYATRTEPPSYLALEKTVRTGPYTTYSVGFCVENGNWCSGNANLIRQFRKPLNLKLD